MASPTVPHCHQYSAAPPNGSVATTTVGSVATTTVERWERGLLITMIAVAVITTVLLFTMHTDCREFLTKGLPTFWHKELKPFLLQPEVAYAALAITAAGALGAIAYALHRYHAPAAVGAQLLQGVTAMRVLRVLEQLTLIGLAIYAGYTNPKLFLPFFGIGIALGVYLHRQRGQECAGGGDGNGAMCAGGFLSDLTRVKLPPPVPLLINAAMMWDHIAHHSKIFVPIVALNAGVWVGNLMAEYVHYKQAIAAPAPLVAISAISK